MNILVIGQCSLHWGRMEFGNIGNYYIIEPFFRELHECFPNAEIKTTFQMSQRFCRDENVTVLPMDLYYGWRENEIDFARRELSISEAIKSAGKSTASTPYIDAVLWADLVIDFSGDIWGDNANLLGKDRFEVGLLKDLIAQNIGKPTAMLAGSPGPFSNPKTRDLAKQVYSKFKLVTNREPISTAMLKDLGFETANTIDLACPAFLFEPASTEKIRPLLLRAGLETKKKNKPTIGFIICGWNFQNGPFDRWPRENKEYDHFADAVEFIIEDIGAQVCLLSHSNGFDIPPAPFHLKHGRDYPIAKQFQEILQVRGIHKDLFCLDGVYDAQETKAIIGQFDMLVSGRVHAAVAALSQSVPTVIIDYGHEPKAHKLQGFASVAGIPDYIADPAKPADLKEKIAKCWINMLEVRSFLDRKMPSVKQSSKENFSRLKRIFE